MAPSFPSRSFGSRDRGAFQRLSSVSLSTTSPIDEAVDNESSSSDECPFEFSTSIASNPPNAAISSRKLIGSSMLQSTGGMSSALSEIQFLFFPRFKKSELPQSLNSLNHKLLSFPRLASVLYSKGWIRHLINAAVHGLGSTINSSIVPSVVFFVLLKTNLPSFAVLLSPAESLGITTFVDSFMNHDVNLTSCDQKLIKPFLSLIFKKLHCSHLEFTNYRFISFILLLSVIQSSSVLLTLTEQQHISSKIYQILNNLNYLEHHDLHLFLELFHDVSF
ncbi:hypothetical protein GEMRC1_009546 [Eukaryota sp. GEM-RC1]